MEGRELRRCYTQMDFSTMRSFRNHNLHGAHNQGRLRNNAHLSPKAKSKFPTMEIYRPPGQRGDGMVETGGQVPGKQLNVHAKEFVMNPALQTSKSTGNILSENSKQSNSILLSPDKQTPSKNAHVRWEDRSGRGLQRSKSMSATKSSSPTPAGDLEVTPLGPLTKQDYTSIKHAIDGTSKLSTEEVMNIVKLLIDRVIQSRSYATVIASACDKIIEKENGSMFFDSLVNYCQFTLNKLKENSVNKKYNGIMGFICELYIMIKPKQLPRDPRWGLPSVQLLLRLLIKCGHEILQDAHLHLKPDQVESLFLTMTTIGRDMEKEMPQAMDGLIASIRDSFLLNSKLTRSIKHTLLQIIEIHAAGWQLPAFTLMYYNSSNYIK